MCCVASVVICVALESCVRDNVVSLDDCGVGSFLHYDGRAVKVDAVVDNKQRVIIIDNVVVD